MGAVVSNGRTGRSDADQPTVMKVARTPVFVDNCVHHAIYSTGNTDSKMSVAPAKKNSFQVTSDRTYQAIEEESAVRLVHTQTPGHFYEGDVYFDGGKLSTGSTNPVVIYGSEDYSERLVSDKVETANSGSRLTLGNMKDKTLQQIGFEETSVRLGHELDVGLRTTDLAMKLAVMGVDDVMTSVNLWRKSAPYAVGQEKVQHSQKFLAHNFYRTNLMSALRFIGRHDKRIIRHDNFGNLSYMKINSGGVVKSLYSVDAELQKKERAPLSINRLTVIGKQRALNDNVQAVINNSMGQINRDTSVSKKDAGPIFDPTIKNLSSARQLGREILSQNMKATSDIVITGASQNQSLDAGDSIIMGNSKKMVSKVSHKLKAGTSDIVLSDGFTVTESYNRFLEDSPFKHESETHDSTSGEVKEVLSFTGFLTPNMMVLLSGRTLSQARRLIGGSTRAIIGRKGNYTGSSDIGMVGIVSITAGGSGYSVNDVITMTNSISTATKLQLRVRDVSGSGAVEKVVITTVGTEYDLGDNLTQHSVSPSGGSSFQCTVPIKPHGFTLKGEAAGPCKSFNVKQGGVI